MKKRIYISGAITGTSDYIDRFANAQMELREHGWSACNIPGYNQRTGSNS
mgnify:CR=1 FL=1